MDDKTLGAVKELASKVEVLSESAWEILIRQAYISCSINLALIISLVLANLYAVRLLRSRIKDLDEDYKPISLFLTLILSCMTILIVFGTLSAQVSGLLNPEYWAIKEILRAVDYEHHL